jgi:hypothetical protein
MFTLHDDVGIPILLLAALRKGHLIGVEFDTIGMRVTGTFWSVKNLTLSMRGKGREEGRSKCESYTH